MNQGYYRLSNGQISLYTPPTSDYEKKLLENRFAGATYIGQSYGGSTAPISQSIPAPVVNTPISTPTNFYLPSIKYIPEYTGTDISLLKSSLDSATKRYQSVGDNYPQMVAAQKAYDMALTKPLQTPEQKAMAESAARSLGLGSVAEASKILAERTDLSSLKANLDKANANYRSTGAGYVEMVNAQKAYDDAVAKQNSPNSQMISNEEALNLAKTMGATPEQINNLQNKLAGGATVSNDTASKMDAEFQKIMNNPDIPADEKKLFQNFYDVSWKNDPANAAKMLKSLNFGLEYSDPIFKAKAAIAKNALETALSGNSTDLAFKENQLTNTLNDLKANTEASKGYLDFTHTQELEKLAKSYEQDLQTTRDNLASVGKTSSSVRSRAEQLLNENNAGLVESSNKQFAYQTGQQNRTLASSERDLPLEIAQLRDEANRKRIADLRKTETDLGSLGLSNLGYSGNDVLGGIPSEIGQNKIKDALSWSKLGMNFF